ncbi:MAG: cyclase family protein [Thermoplasmatota archaeon]
MALFDISRRVTTRSAHFPGDTPFSCEWPLMLERGASVNLSAVRTSPHVGTHVDAFSHYDVKGASVEALPLDAFLGPCRVVSIAPGLPFVTREHVAHLDLAREERILFHTARRIEPERWDANFTAMAPDLARELSRAAVRLVGLDTPSFDPAAAKDLAAHKALGAGGVVNVENLDLTGVPDGRYEFIGLPLRWTGVEASPIRAVLRSV